MFGFATILSTSIWVLLLASPSVLASPKPSPLRTLQLSARSDSVPNLVPQCEAPCVKLEDTLGNATSAAEGCTQSVMSMFESCFDCEANAGAATVEVLQNAVNSFTRSCALIDHPVNNITVAAKNTNDGERVAVGMLRLSGVVVGLATLSLVAL
ncbi:hypothetical protein R3P38DRAFT_2974426 [Favolaschia claudopus]|uniref:Uncharacterized protein n=1 Tax=Favolaschia claudopus TaxID=2862362 RepID=A0AAW0B1U5_9AGAR